MAGLDKAEEPVGEDAGREEAEQESSVRLLCDVLQRAVEPDGLPRPLLARRLDQEEPDQREHEHPRYVARESDRLHERTLGARDLPRLELLLKAAGQGPPAVEEPDADDHDARAC